MINRLSLLYLLLLPFIACSQRKSALLDSILRTTPLMSKVAAGKATYQPQIIYTQINRDEKGRPSFRNFTYNVDSSRYFYCASLVKLPVSVFALEKINALDQKGITRETGMITDSSALCQVRAEKDTSAPGGYPTVAHYIRKMLLVSDNNSFSRLFEFVTPDYAHQRMTQLGFPTARIIHRFDVPCIGAGNRHMNPVTFIDPYGKALHKQEGDSVKMIYTPPFPKMFAGKDIYNKKKRLVAAKKDFSKSNYLSLRMIHNFVKDIVFLDTASKGRRLGITADDRRFLLTNMGMYPRESERPVYDPQSYYDSYKKYFIYGAVTKKIGEDSVRIFNIVGRAYGFVSDCAYIVNISKGIEYMLSAVIYTNKRNTFGSGNYEYDAIGLPFLRELSLALYSLESTRKKRNIPDLSPFYLFKKNNN